MTPAEAAKPTHSKIMDTTKSPTELAAVPCSPPCPHCGLPPEEKKAPVQGYGPGIPWSMHLRAYDAYCKRYGPQKALIEGWCRGGFGTSELDMFIPGWRDELSVMNHLKAELAALREENARLKAENDQAVPAAAGGSESNPTPCPPLGTSE